MSDDGVILVKEKREMQTFCDDYSRIEKAILFLDANFRSQPSLSDVARSANLSEHHFQRLFRRWAGISPKRFLQFLTIEYAKELLAESRSVLDATYEAGLSSPGRLHDLFTNIEAVTPGEFKNRGTGLKIDYGFHWSPFGVCLLAVTERGICGLSFLLHGDHEKAVQELKSRWPGASFEENSEKTAPLVDQVFPPIGPKGARALSLFLRGTNFQIKVWEALLRIPEGSVVSYEDLALHLGKPGAARAVGSAVGQNPIAFIIPCHRVIRKMGVTGNYGGGPARKKAMLAWEAGRRHSEDDLEPGSAPPLLTLTG
jgi:AraC family transcriptional regulator, regulatory protein of adaptative response / methylated-DNA-[protein]-cysteine methyltransferase